MQRNVVVTGIGVVSPIGIGKEQYWKGLSEGISGFRPISLFDISGMKPDIAGEITDFDPVLLLGKKGLRELDRSTRLINAAAKLAIEDTDFEISDHNTHDIGVCIGTTFGSLHSIFQFDRSGLIDGPRLVNPSFFPNTVINSPASRISIRFKIKGFNTTLSTGFCAGLDALMYASDFIRLGRVQAVVSGGTEELCEEIFSGFNQLGLLAGTDGSFPICCPFDARRNGLILSEGAAVMIIEDLEYALKRGAPISARILGYGNAFDPTCNRTLFKSGKGLENAIKFALKDASLGPGDIDYICSSANSTKWLDKMETHAIKDVFEKHTNQIPVTSIKSMVGETYSASGALSVAATVGAIKNGIIPPTINYQAKDPECDLDYVPNIARKKDITNALVISSDTFGHNSAIVIGKYE